MSNADVRLCWGPNACVGYRTGNDGMYYLQVNPGSYQLVVNGTPRGNVVIPMQPYYDLAPVPGN